MKRRYAIGRVFFLCFAVLFGTQVGAQELRTKRLSERTAMAGNVEYVRGEILAKYREGVTQWKVARLNKSLGIELLSTHNGGVHRLSVPPGKTEQEMVALLRSDPCVEYAELNTICRASMIPNDPLYDPYQWHFPAVNCPAAWDLSSGSCVIVGILDTGIAYEDYPVPAYELGTVRAGVTQYQRCPDLEGTLFTAGYDFINNDSHPNDNNAHGTHVAGTVAQTTNNSTGVAGMAFSAVLMPVKVLDYAGYGTAQSLADGLYWATDQGAQVINMSLSWPPGYNPGSTIQNAIQYAYNAGVVLVGSSGNQGVSPVSYPAAYTEVIAVGATRYDDQLTSYSQYGSAQEFTAPGGDLAVDQNGDSYGDGVLQQTFSGYVEGPPEVLADPTDFGYYFYEGTSMAAPHVTALVAMMISSNQTGVENIRAILRNTAVDLGSAGWDQYYGHGRIDAQAALTYSEPPPVAQFSGTPTSGCIGMTVDFADSSTGTIDTWDWDFGDGSPHSGMQNPSHQYTAAGDYTVTLTVSGLYGTDDEIKTDYVHVDGGPTASPTGVAASDELCDGIDVTWTWNGSGQDGFRVYRNGSHVFTGNDPEQRDWSDLDAEPGTTYDYFVRAYNNCANGPASNTDQGTRLEEVLALTSPNGGEVWLVGSSYPITWTFNQCVSAVDIEISRSGPGGPWETLFAGTPNDGNESWTVTEPTAADCYVRVSDASDDIPVDPSDGPFEIASETLTVHVPNGGELWCSGSSRMIEWSSDNFSGRVKIELSRSGPSGPWEVLFADTDNDGSEPWTVTGPISSDCFVKVSDVSDGVPEDTSDAAYTIEDPWIAVGAPNGGEQWLDGEDRAITWQSNSCVSAVNVGLSRSGPDGPWETLFAGIENDGNETWRVGGPGSDDCYIRVCDAQAGAWCDISDFAFGIDVTSCDSLYLPTGWSMVSLTREVADSSASCLFPGMFVYAYDSSTLQYESVEVLSRGRGYWVGNAGSDTAVPIRGLPIDRWVSALYPGWEMIGSVCQAASFADPQDDPDGSILAGTLYWYDPSNLSYVPQDSILPGRGYWVAASQPCDLTVASGGPGSASASPSARRDKPSERFGTEAWSLPIVVGSPDGLRRIELCLGVCDNATPGLDPGLDVPLPPKAPTEAALDAALSIDRSAFGRLRRDIRLQGEEAEWKVEIESEEGFVLAWPSEELPPGKFELTAVSGTIDMRCQSSYSCDLAGSWVGYIRHVCDEGPQDPPVADTDRLELNGPYPNPVTQNMWVSYRIPEACRVSIDVHDVNGRLVKTIVHRWVAPGSYRASWDGKTRFGEEATEGVYLCVMKAGDFVHRQKFVLLR